MEGRILLFLIPPLFTFHFSPLLFFSFDISLIQITSLLILLFSSFFLLSTHLIFLFLPPFHLPILYLLYLHVLNSLRPPSSFLATFILFLFFLPLILQSPLTLSPLYTSNFPLLPPSFSSVSPPYLLFCFLLNFSSFYCIYHYLFCYTSHPINYFLLFELPLSLLSSLLLIPLPSSLSPHHQTLLFPLLLHFSHFLSSAIFFSLH